MKFIKTLVLACICFTGMLTAQDDMYIKMEITGVESSNPEAGAMLEMMKGTETEVFHKDGKSLTNINMMGGMVAIKNVIDKEGGMNMYFDMMGNKMHVESTKLEMDKMKAENPNPLSDLDISYDKEDTKTIAGHECYKMTVKSKDPDAGGFNIAAYVTEDIQINASVIQGVDISEFAGFPLEYILDMGEAKLVVTTKELKDEIPAGTFNIDADGYTKMSMEEFMESLGGMGAGFGF